MSDLISRGKLFNRLAPVQTLGEAYGIIQEMPTVDAVPVVRCKDCLHNRACEIQYNAQAGDLFFCGAAERKDGNGNETD